MSREIESYRAVLVCRQCFWQGLVSQCPQTEHPLAGEEAADAPHGRLCPNCQAVLAQEGWLGLSHFPDATAVLDTGSTLQ